MSDLFSPVDEADIPAPNGRAKKYDPLIDHAFANPDQWFKVNKPFKSQQTAAGIRKPYKDEADEAGRVVHVRTRQEGSSWYAYVAVLTPEEDAEPDAAEETE